MESIAYVIALVGMPFLIFIPMSSLRRFGTTEFPQDLVFWAEGKYDECCGYRDLSRLGIIIGLLYILPVFPR